MWNSDLVAIKHWEIVQEKSTWFQDPFLCHSRPVWTRLMYIYMSFGVEGKPYTVVKQFMSVIQMYFCGLYRVADSQLTVLFYILILILCQGTIQLEELWLRKLHMKNSNTWASLWGLGACKINLVATPENFRKYLPGNARERKT